MGKKYLIELEQTYKAKNYKGEGPVKLYRAKGFNTLVFDEFGVEKLEEYIDDSFNEGYQAGIDKVERLIKKIFTMNHTNRVDYFGTTHIVDIFLNNDIQSILDTMEIYEKNNIKIGDEVETDIGDVGVVVKIKDSNSNEFLVMSRSGEQYEYTKDITWIKTGRYFPEVVELFRKLNEVY